METNDDKKREYGYYWIKRAGEKWEVALYDFSWGMDGWWSCGQEYAFYDDDGTIEEVGTIVNPPNAKDLP
jgi:hypothetical protein